MIYYAFMVTSLGKVLLTADAAALTGCYFVGQKYEPPIAANWQQNDEHPVLKMAQQQLLNYFVKQRQQFDTPVTFSYGTSFQRDVWEALLTIPFGQTISYQQLAMQVGKPSGVRAVANAVGRNPVSILVPCHRVIGSNGTLTGYAGGLVRKQALLDIERST